MSLTTLAYARRAYKSFSRSARHVCQLIASHQALETGWAYVSYTCLADEASLTPRRVMQLVAVLEEKHAIEVRRGHGRGHTNFYRILDEHTGQPVPPRAAKKVKSAGDAGAEKVKFPTPPAAEKVKSETPNARQSLRKAPAKDIETKERKTKAAPAAPCSLSGQDGAAAPARVDISPEVMRKFGLRYGLDEWPPRRREKD
jgi:hypothetical protein